MSNSAIIRGKGENLGVYLHWNGGYDSVYAFTQYCKLKGYRSPETDDYGIARLCQVVGNFFGGSVSVGVCILTDMKKLTPEKVAKLGVDNGVYEIKNWEIVEHWNNDLIPDGQETPGECYDITDMLCYIDNSMPANEQLGEDYIRADIVNTDTLKIGDKVYMKNYDDKAEIHTVVGIATNGPCHKTGPYVDLYDHEDDGYSWNANNYIHDKTVRKVKDCE